MTSLAPIREGKCATGDAPPAPSHDQANPAHRTCHLSEDIVALVFYELLWSLPPHKRSISPIALPLSQVSQLWRCVALAHKRLWSYIPLTSRELAVLFLGRSSPIKISIYVPEDHIKGSDRRKAAVEEILRHPARIRVFVNWTWGIPYAFAQRRTPPNLAQSTDLEALGLWMTDLDDNAIAQLGGCGKLRSLTLSNRCRLQFAEPIVLAHVTKLSIYEYSLEFPIFERLMLCVPALEHLVLYRAEFWGTQASGPTHTLPRMLKSLQLATSGMFAMHFLSLFHISDATRLSIHVLDNLNFQYHLLEDPGPPDADMSISERIFLQSGRTEHILHEIPWAFARVLESFHGDISLIIRPHGRNAVEILCEDRPVEGIEQIIPRASCSLSLYHPDVAFMSQAVQISIHCLTPPNGWREVRLENGLRTSVVHFVLAFLTENAQTDKLKQLQLCISQARLQRLPLSDALAALNHMWPTLQVTTLMTASSAVVVEESDSGDDDQENTSEDDAFGWGLDESADEMGDGGVDAFGDDGAQNGAWDEEDGDGEEDEDIEGA